MKAMAVSDFAFFFAKVSSPILRDAHECPTDPNDANPDIHRPSVRPPKMVFGANSNPDFEIIQTDESRTEEEASRFSNDREL
jgi:hypothetical protein